MPYQNSRVMATVIVTALSSSGTGTASIKAKAPVNRVNLTPTICSWVGYRARGEVQRPSRPQGGMSARRYGPPTVGGGDLAPLFAAGSSISQSMLLTVPV